MTAMSVLVSGAGGLVGSALRERLAASGHSVVALVRDIDPHARRSVVWDPGFEVIDKRRLEGFDAVVHLAGESLRGRWTPQRKERIRDSRVAGTQLLAQSLAKLDRKPKVLACASAIGYYGDSGAEWVDETAEPGDLFLSTVTAEWERACDPARAAGIRVVNLRSGLVLSADGGALATMLAPFRLGLGGTVGNPGNYLSWISIDDEAAAIEFVLQDERLDGPVNLTTPNAVTWREFAKTLGRVVGRPAVIPVPGFLARLALGQSADEMLLASERVKPAKLIDAGFGFQHPELEGALRHLLGKGL